MATREGNPPEVDPLYGLEPVIEPADGEASREGAEGLQSRTVQCPYCGEAFETIVDLSSGSMSYIEDCQVCCRPIEFRLRIEDDGAPAALEIGRSD